MLATYYGSLTSLSDPAFGFGSPAVAVGTAIDTLNGATAHPATSGVFGARCGVALLSRLLWCVTCDWLLQVLGVRQEYNQRAGDVGFCG